MAYKVPNYISLRLKISQLKKISFYLQATNFKQIVVAPFPIKIS